MTVLRMRHLTPEAIEMLAELWRVGMDTCDMSKASGLREAVICRYMPMIRQRAKQKEAA